MTYQQATLSDDLNILPRMPAWVTCGGSETPEDIAFRSGAALANLHAVATWPELPHALWRERLALRAAEVCVARSRRPVRASELRDAVCFLRPGDQPGPAGEVTLAWQCAVARPISIKALHRSLPHDGPEQIAAWLDAGQGSPVARASAVLESVLTQRPREECTALILAEASLAQALGWKNVTPVLAAGLKPRDLRKTGEDLRLACHHALIASVAKAVQMAADLTRRAARLHAVAPKLRAKGAGAAVQLFLSHDAVTPTALPLADRAARRFCDRLVDLGVVRELTGRDTFRIYGL